MADNPRTTPGMRAMLTIAGSDCCGAAGVQADIKTATAMGAYAASAITAITVQTTAKLKRVEPVDPKLIVEQIEAVASDIKLAAVKVGMLPTVAAVKAVAAAVKQNNLYPLVVDPSMVTKAGDALVEEDVIKAVAARLFPEAAVVTPNAREAALLSGKGGTIDSVAGASEAARLICRKHKARACIVKGIRRDNDHEGDAVDVFYDGSETHELVSDWRPTTNTAGAGCTFSAAITAALALEQPLPDAVQTAKNAVSEAIRQGSDLGSGPGPVNHAAVMKTTK